MPYIYKWRFENGIAGIFKVLKRNRGVTETYRIELIQCYSKQSAHKTTDAASDYILQNSLHLPTRARRVKKKNYNNHSLRGRTTPGLKQFGHIALNLIFLKRTSTRCII